MCIPIQSSIIKDNTMFTSSKLLLISATLLLLGAGCGNASQLSGARQQAPVGDRSAVTRYADTLSEEEYNTYNSVKPGISFAAAGLLACEDGSFINPQGGLVFTAEDAKNTIGGEWVIDSPKKPEEYAKTCAIGFLARDAANKKRGFGIGSTKPDTTISGWMGKATWLMRIPELGQSGYLLPAYRYDAPTKRILLDTGGAWFAGFTKGDREYVILAAEMNENELRTIAKKIYDRVR